MKNLRKSASDQPLFPYFSILALLSASAALVPLHASQANDSVQTDAQIAKHATALCTDMRLQASNSLSPETTYTGEELITQVGDTVTAEYMPDRLTGFAGTVISYERMTREDAMQLGFKIETGMALYMLHGDEELPSEYVLLPQHMGDVATRRFQALYGTCNDDGAYDPTHVTRMSCVLK